MTSVLSSNVEDSRHTGSNRLDALETSAFVERWKSGARIFSSRGAFRFMQHFVIGGIGANQLVFQA